MYIPPQFEETRREVLVAAMREIRLAGLVTADGATYHATHVPVLVREDGGTLTLEAHVAKANPHWTALDRPRASLATFQGPHAYVSPSFYASKREHGKVVPTWNYVIVEARGTLEAIADEDWLLSHLAALTEFTEAQRPEPWATSDAPDGFIRNLSRAIVGIRFTVETLAGSWKLIQHKPEADRRGTIDGLSASARGGDREIARAMAALAKGDQPAS
ncbi:FMN-binding negative transcriptional regulator [Jiella sp. M17.18]|uniref:FMN-binding negative transcriptional regulator n=1 Tax=Jiella sp. M17.18 TaxID=3234247 RepID=UPI0034DF231F